MNGSQPVNKHTMNQTVQQSHTLGTETGGKGARFVWRDGGRFLGRSWDLKTDQEFAGGPGPGVQAARAELAAQSHGHLLMEGKLRGQWREELPGQTANRGPCVLAEERGCAAAVLKTGHLKRARL